MHRIMIGLSVIALIFAVGCSGEDAEEAAKSMADKAKSATDAAGNAAGNLADSAGNLQAKAGDMAAEAGSSAKDAAASMAGNAVAACRAFAEQGAWESALEVCKKAHEMMPDDLALEHAYQQAQAAAGQ